MDLARGSREVLHETELHSSEKPFKSCLKETLERSAGKGWAGAVGPDSNSDL